MGEGHAVAHLGEQPQPRQHVEPPAVAVAIDRLTLHVLHHEVRLAQRGDAAIEQARQRRVLERRENLPLRPELRHERRVRQPQVHDLDGHPLLELVVGTSGFVDRRHAAAGNERGDLVVAQTHAQMRVDVAAVVELVLLREQGTDLGHERRITAAARLQGGLTIGAMRHIHQVVEDRLELLPAGVFHRDESGSYCACAVSAIPQMTEVCGPWRPWPRPAPVSVCVGRGQSKGTHP